MSRQFRSSDVVATVVTVLFGGITGWLLAETIGAVLGAGLGAAFGVVAGRANVRPAITMTVWVGAMAGALVGASIVETICLPDTCPAMESTAAVVTGLAALVGVGLVAALVTRSFDEYYEQQEPTSPDEDPGNSA
ncbi:MAG: hypothetical protein ACR2N2_12580 [Acidimicrobiia bacterium]